MREFFKEEVLKKKFMFACGAMLLSAAVCIFKGYDGSIYRDIAVCVSGLYLGSQAYVDAKAKKEAANVTVQP